MGILQKTESEVAIDENDREGIYLNMIALPLTKFSAPQKPRLSCQNLNDVLERKSFISSSASMIIVILLVQSKDELQQKKNIFQRVIESMKLKSVSVIIKDAHFEYSICKIGKNILLCLFFFEILKVIDLLSLYFRTFSLFITALLWVIYIIKYLSANYSMYSKLSV